jgi:hypothetical protein
LLSNVFLSFRNLYSPRKRWTGSKCRRDWERKTRRLLYTNALILSGFLLFCFHWNKLLYLHIYSDRSKIISHDNIKCVVHMDFPSYCIVVRILWSNYKMKGVLNEIQEVPNSRKIDINFIYNKYQYGPRIYTSIKNNRPNNFS